MFYMKNNGSLDQIDVRMIESNIKRLGHKGYLDSLLKDMNCIDRIMPNGQHIMQTIGFPYQHIYNKFDYTIDAGLADKKLLPGDATHYWAEYNQVHEANLKWEMLNPPTEYDMTKSKAKTKRVAKLKVPKSTNIINKDISDKPTVAQRKATAKSAKLSKLKFSFKTVNDDNTI